MDELETRPSKLKILSMVFCLLFLVALIVGFTYALFKFSDLGDEENSVTTGTLIMEIDETGSQSIELTDKYPVSDEDGMQGPAYTFTIRNTGSLTAKYRLRLVKDEDLYENYEKADATHIKYGLQKGDAEPIIGLLGNDDNILITDETLVGPSGSQVYSIRVWVDSEEDIDNSFFDTNTLEFHGHVELDAIHDGHTNYETGE